MLGKWVPSVLVEKHRIERSLNADFWAHMREGNGLLALLALFAIC